MKQAPAHLTIAVLLVSSGLAIAAEPIGFVREVRPIFEKHCFGCHGASKQKSGLRLDIKARPFLGGERFGPSIIRRSAQTSPLMRLVRGMEAGLRMPPEGERLSPAEIDTLARWIDAGAHWPDGLDPAEAEDARSHWSFQPVLRPAVPEAAPDWAKNPVDGFILSRLETAGLQPAPQAERASWLRRVSFDLLGLPPTPEQVQRFLEDRSPAAFEHVVDELLASPHYGVHWAQHWLDVVRYADTHGFEVNTERPQAWPYRDYVIRAFNGDIPYDQFVREQIAGDALGEDAATGFLVTASVLLPGQIGQDEPSKRLARQDALDEIVVNLGQTFLGLSVGCARCHDHKFDPISQRDYYALQAFVAGVEYGERDLRTPEAEARRRDIAQWQQGLIELEHRLDRLVPLANSGVERPPVNPRRNVDRFTPIKTARLRFTILTTNNLEPCVDELEVFNSASENIALASRGTRSTSSSDTVVANRHELRHVNDGEYGNSRSWMSNQTGQGWIELEFPETHSIDRIVWGRDREGKYTDRLATAYRIAVADDASAWRTVADSSDRAAFRGEIQAAPITTAGLSAHDADQARQLLAEKAALESQIARATGEQKVFAGVFRSPDRIHRLTRGDPEQPQEEVAPAVLGALGPVELPPDAPEQERRRTLADWIANPTNPLTARVMVNRIWQGHFGCGIVETPSDFGLNGAKPSHPKLLDWLAEEFVRSGWSIKHLHRLIVLSATYRQSTRLNPNAATQDADVRLLWRFPTRRLEAETIRDSLLQVSGRLNDGMGGRGFDLFQQRGGLTGFVPIESPSGDGLRRMIFAHKVRRERDAVFGAFDCPDGGQSTSRRRESTTPIQALNLFNSRFTLDAAEAFAARVRAEAGDDPGHQLRRAYQLALSREPTEDEIAAAAPVIREYGLPLLGRVLFNSNEFLFLP